MSVTMFGRLRGTYTEEQYLALGESSVKIELFDGFVVMSPPANIEHQHIAAELRQAMKLAARAARLTESVAAEGASLRLPAPLDVVIDPLTFED
jgi:hypothetical protein